MKRGKPDKNTIAPMNSGSDKPLENFALNFHTAPPVSDTKAGTAQP
jgi:hypothetical protein